MESERIERRRRSTLVQIAMEVNETLRRIREDFPDHPDCMQYFYDRLRDSQNGENFSGAGRKLIGTMCSLAPVELIYASGAVPVTVCSGANAFDHQGAELLPARSCSLIRSTIGRLQSMRDSGSVNLDAIAVPATCDHKRKAAELLSDMGFNVCMIEVPPTRDSEEASYYWQNSVKNFALTLQGVTGVKITRKRLMQAVSTMNEARKQYRRLSKFLASQPTPMYGTDMFAVASAYAVDDINDWTRAVAALNDELDLRIKNGVFVGKGSTPRVLLTGSPPVFPNLKVPILVEQSGAAIVADEVCSSSRLLHDAPAFDEGRLYDILPAIANRYLKPCTYPFLAPNTERKRRLLALVEKFSAHGVVYQAYPGCTPYEMEHRSVADALMKKGVPMLYLETDFSPEDTGQLSTRVEAFIDSIKSRMRGTKL